MGIEKFVIFNSQFGVNCFDIITWYLDTKRKNDPI